MLTRSTLGFVCFLGLAGCVAPRTAPPDLLGLRASWTAFLAGLDLRPLCSTSLSSRFRVVRPDGRGSALITAEIVEDPTTGGALLDVRSISEADIAASSPFDPDASWHGSSTLSRLPAPVYAALVLWLTSNGAFGDRPVQVDPPVLDLPAWIISGCHEGQWFRHQPPTAGSSVPSVRL